MYSIMGLLKTLRQFFRNSKVRSKTRKVKRNFRKKAQKGG